jgi:hypothetical protein
MRTLRWLICLYIPHLYLNTVSPNSIAQYPVGSLGNNFYDVEGIDRQYRFPVVCASSDYLDSQLEVLGTSTLCFM